MRWTRAGVVAVVGMVLVGCSSQADEPMEAQRTVTVTVPASSTVFTSARASETTSATEWFRPTPTQGGTASVSSGAAQAGLRVGLMGRLTDATGAQAPTDIDALQTWLKQRTGVTWTKRVESFTSPGGDSIPDAFLSYGNSTFAWAYDEQGVLQLRGHRLMGAQCGDEPLRAPVPPAVAAIRINGNIQVGMTLAQVKKLMEATEFSPFRVNPDQVGACACGTVGKVGVCFTNPHPNGPLPPNATVAGSWGGI